MNYQKLADHMANEHDLILIESELREIVRSIAPELIAHFMGRTNTHVHPKAMEYYLNAEI